MTDHGVQDGLAQLNFGNASLRLVSSLFDRDINRVVVIMRHSAREYDPKINDLLNPLTDQGRTYSREFGRRLPKDVYVKGYASPPERCVETGELAIQAHVAEHGLAQSVRPVEGLGVFYAIDQIKMWKGMKAAGGLSDYLRQWLDHKISEDTMLSPTYAATTILRLLKGKLERPSDHKKQLDLCVSHDMTVLFLRDFFGLEPVSAQPVEYLDGLALYFDDGRLMLESQHGGSAQIKLPPY